MMLPCCTRPRCAAVTTLSLFLGDAGWAPPLTMHVYQPAPERRLACAHLGRQWLQERRIVQPLRAPMCQRLCCAGDAHSAPDGARLLLLGSCDGRDVRLLGVKAVLLVLSIACSVDDFSELHKSHTRSYTSKLVGHKALQQLARQDPIGPWGSCFRSAMTS